MKNKKMVMAIVGLVLLILIGLLMFLKSNNTKGNIESVERVISSVNGHKEEDIEHTFDMIEEEFNTKDYKDCVLKKIEYSRFVVNDKDIEDVYKEQYDADEAIYLKYEFTTGSKPATGFVKDEDYEYTAVFIKKENTWELKDCGQGI